MSGDDQARPCPRCRYDLREMVAAGLRRCPECGLRFSDQDLLLLRRGPDPQGRLIRANPRESRVTGRWLVVGFLAAALVLMGLSTALAYRLLGRG